MEENTNEEHVTLVFNRLKEQVQLGSLEQIKHTIENYSGDLVNRIDPLDKQTPIFYLS
jgi:hypothetical protein